MIIQKPTKINRNDYKKIYIGSDFHYNHQRDFIWTPRGFDAAYKHDKFIEDECDKLTADDLLIYMGDFSLNSNRESTLNLMKRIKAQKFYIWGNHEGEPMRLYKDGVDRFWNTINLPDAYNRNNVEVYPLTIDVYNFATHIGCHKQAAHENLLTFFGNDAIFQIGNQFYHCKHMAPVIWDKMKYENQVCLCGHSHGNFKDININTDKLGKILDVGVDNAIKHNGNAFFALEDVDAIMKTKAIKIHDHHGDDNL
jgi:calcineurin-like phosphoesterase family protein